MVVEWWVELPDAAASPSEAVATRLRDFEPGELLDAAPLIGGTIAAGAHLVATGLGVVLCSPRDDLDCATAWQQIGPFDPSDAIPRLSAFFPEIVGSTVEARFARNLAALADQLHELDNVPDAGRRLVRVRVLPSEPESKSKSEAAGRVGGESVSVQLPSTPTSRLRTDPPKVAVSFAAPRRELPRQEPPRRQSIFTDRHPPAALPSRPSLVTALAAAALGIFGLLVLSIGERGGGDNDPGAIDRETLVNSVDEANTDVLGQRQSTTAVCHPSYGGCVPVASDVDCDGDAAFGVITVSGPIDVLGVDVYGLDPDGDGIGCDS